MSYQTGVINEFRGKNYFLSNYYTAPMTWQGTEFHSAEQAFAYAKSFCAMHAMAETFGAQQILDAKTPGEAKALGKKLAISVDEWDARKVMYMREIVHAKFLTAVGLAGMLVNTGAQMLVEGNDWGDTFWGRCKNSESRWVGLNTLGVILMEERGWWSRSDKGRPT